MNPFETFVWGAEALLAARLTPDGTVTEASPAFLGLAGERTSLLDIVRLEQRAGLRGRLETAGETWTTGLVGVLERGSGTVADRRLWLRRDGDVILAIAEPAVVEQDRLVEQVLALNDDLVAARREVTRLYERERVVAETLQRSLLPEVLPAIDGLELRARYVPGTATEVGGDWYDVLPLPSGEVVLVVGDVAGKGLRAATLMGEVRNAVRAYAFDEPDPERVLFGVNRLVERAGQMVTAVVGVLDPATRTYRQGNAGHLPPLVVGPAGETQLLSKGRSGPLLVYEPNGGTERRLDPGATLVLYTDGLVERRGEPLDEGLERVRRIASEAAPDLDLLCDRLLASVPGGDRRDDVAILAVRLAVRPSAG